MAKTKPLTLETHPELHSKKLLNNGWGAHQTQDSDDAKGKIIIY